MSSSKRGKNRQPNQKQGKQNNTQSKQYVTNQPFEENQLRNIQVMVAFLANKAYLSMGKTGSELTPEALAPLRLYAQYLNLYMKFKDKCFPNQEQILIPQAPQIITDGINETPKPQVPTTSTQKNNQSSEVQQNPEANRVKQASQTTALLMVPPNNAKDSDQILKHSESCRKWESKPPAEPEVPNPL